MCGLLSTFISLSCTSHSSLKCYYASPTDIWELHRTLFSFFMSCALVKHRLMLAHRCLCVNTGCAYQQKTMGRRHLHYHLHFLSFGPSVFKCPDSMFRLIKDLPGISAYQETVRLRAFILMLHNCRLFFLKWNYVILRIDKHASNYLF